MSGYDHKWAGLFFDKGGAVYNVMHPEFGAVGDGVTDDAAAIALAVDAAASVGGVIYFPPGIYYFATQLAFDEDDLTIIGAGWGRTILLCGTTSINAVLVTGARPQMRGIEIQYDSAAGASTYGLHILGSSYGLYEGIKVSTNAEDGILVEGNTGGASSNAARNYFRNVFVDSPGAYGVTLSGADGSHLVLDNVFDGLEVQSSGDDAVHVVDYVQGLSICGRSLFESCATGINIAATAASRSFRIHLDGPIFKSITGKHINAAYTYDQ